MSVLSPSESKFLKNIIKNPEENFEKVVSLMENKIQECTTELETSERKIDKLIENLIESEKKYRSLFEQSQLGITIVGNDLKFISVNPKFCDILGYSKQELLSMNITDIGYPDYVSNYIEAGKKLITGELSYWKTQEQFITKKKDLIWVDLIVSVLSDEYGESYQFLSTINDITEQKEVESAFLKEYEFNKNLIQASPAYFVAINGEWKTILMNQMMLSVLGYTLEEVLYKDYLTNFVPRRDHLLVSEIFKRIISSHEPTLNTNNILTKDGKELLVEWHGRPVFNSDGEFDYFFGLGIDTTERTKAEQKLKESEETFRTIFESIPRGMFLYHLKSDDKLVFANSNPAADEILGVECSQFIGKTIEEAFPPLIDTDVPDTYKKLAKEGGTWNWERIDYQYGQIRGAYEVTAFQIAPNKIVTSFTDITERIEAAKMLKESEEKYRILFNNSPVGIGLSTYDGRVLTMNKSMENITGYRFEEYENINLKDTYVDSNQRDLMINLLREQGYVRDYEAKLKRNDGTEFVALMNIDLIELSGSDIFLTNIRDVTQIRNSEEKLKESEEKYRNLFNLAEVIIVALDPNGYITSLNRKGYEILGYEECILLGRNWFEICYPSDERESIKKNYRESIKSQKMGIIYNESYIQSINGKIRFIAWNNTFLRDEEGHIIGTLSAGQDITESKIAEEALKESEEKYRNLVETSSMGLLEIDNAAKNLIYINPRLLEILEYNEDELLKLKNFDNLIHPEDLKEILSSSRERKLEFRIFSKSSKVKWLFGDRIHFYNEEGELMYIRFWLQDITEKKELEQIKNNLLIRFSHEFKTPLISIKGFSEFLLEEYRDKLNEKVVSFLEKIQEGAEKLKTLTNTFLVSSQLDENNVKIDIKQENISKLINRVLIGLEGVLKSRKHEIDLKIDKDLLVGCDPEKVYMVISNLLLNASKFTPQGGSIAVSATTEKGFVTISVKDSGIGLTKEEKKKLFLPFGKIERYGQGLDIVPDGMGMGLYITKELVELHNGKIWVESAGRNKGSTFTVKIPLNY